MSSRPLTPPCVPFGTRRFNHMKCTDLYAWDMSKYPRRASLSFVMVGCNIPLPEQPNRLSECFRFGKPAIRAYPISSGLPPLFLASSIASIYIRILLRNHSFHCFISVITFASYICCIYTLKFGQYWTSFCIGNSSLSSMPYMQFLFVRPRFRPQRHF